MKFRKIFLIILVILTLIGKEDLEKYLKLRGGSSPSVKKSDLPDEFSDNAFKV